MDEKFWVILRDDDGRLYRHSNIDNAVREARRLAEDVRGHQFFVLETCKVAEEAPRPITVREPKDEIPF